MFETLAKISVYLIIILLAFLLKQTSLFKKENSIVLGRLIVNVTLPAALLNSKPEIVFDAPTLMLAAVAIVTNTIMLYVGYRMHPKRNPKTSAIMLCTSTYNLGSFLLPFILLFFPGEGVIWLCAFDLGNSIMGLGLNYVAAKYVSGQDQKLTVGFVLKSLAKSMPLLTYILIIFLNIFGLSLPVFVQDIVTVASNANSFLCMFMVGLLVELNLPRKEMVEIGKVTAVRVGFNIVFALLVYFFLPVDHIARVITVLCLVGPVATASVVFGQDCGYKGDLIGMVSTLSIIISLVMIVGLLLVFA